MSRRLLLVESDAPARAMMDLLLSAAGHVVHAVSTGREAEALLGSGAIGLALVDEAAGDGAVLDEVRWIRARFPRVPVVVLGTLLSQRALLELLRLGAVDALQKPFLPRELREVVDRTLERESVEDCSLEYAAAMAVAREALFTGKLRDASRAASRAQSVAPFDEEAMALLALVAELEGRDGDADRGYRASLALRHDEGSAPPDAHEGLARLAGYRGARPVSALPARFAGAPVRADLALESGGRDAGAGGEALVVLHGAGVLPAGMGALFLREGPGEEAHVVMMGRLCEKTARAAISSLGCGPLVGPRPGPGGVKPGEHE